MIEAKKVVKHFGLKPVLRGVDFRVEEGEFVALVGPNGAGKTTFLRILASLSKPNMGAISIAGYQLPGQAAAVRKVLGVVSHQPLLYGDLTAEENLNFYARMYDLAEVRDRVEEVLTMVGLKARRRDLLRQFSRGMQQRLAIARAILHDPAVLLFDEPHTGLDQEAAAAQERVLRARGQVVPVRWMTLSFQTSGRVAELAVQVGDVVQAGDVLARLDTRALELEVQAARDDLATQETQLALIMEEIASTQIRVRCCRRSG